MIKKQKSCLFTSRLSNRKLSKYKRDPELKELLGVSKIKKKQIFDTFKQSMYTKTFNQQMRESEEFFHESEEDKIPKKIKTDMLSSYNEPELESKPINRTTSNHQG